MGLFTLFKLSHIVVMCYWATAYLPNAFHLLSSSLVGTRLSYFVILMTSYYGIMLFTTCVGVSWTFRRNVFSDYFNLLPLPKMKVASFLNMWVMIFFSFT